MAKKLSSKRRKMPAKKVSWAIFVFLYTTVPEKIIVSLISRKQTCISIILVYREAQGNGGTVGSHSSFTYRDGGIPVYCSERRSSVYQQEDNIERRM